MIEVYCFTSPSGRRYVGLTSQGLAKRWAQHVSDARNGSPLRFHRAIRKHGPESFTHEILERMTTEAGAKRAEQLWIKELGTFGRGYNATAGGDGLAGLRHTQASKARMREACKGRYFPANLAKAHAPEAVERRAAKIRGVRLSVDHCAKLSAAHTGRTQSAETREKRAAALRDRKRPPEVGAKISATKRKNRKP